MAARIRAIRAASGSSKTEINDPLAVAERSAGVVRCGKSGPVAPTAGPGAYSAPQFLIDPRHPLPRGRRQRRWARKMKAAGRGAERIFSVQLRLLRATSLLRTPLLRAGRLAGDEKPAGDGAERLVE